MFNLILRAAVFALIFSVWIVYLAPIVIPKLSEAYGSFTAHFVSYFTVFIVAWTLALLAEKRLKRGD